MRLFDLRCDLNYSDFGINPIEIEGICTQHNLFLKPEAEHKCYDPGENLETLGGRSLT